MLMLSLFFLSVSSMIFLSVPLPALHVRHTRSQSRFHQVDPQSSEALDDMELNYFTVPQRDG